MEFLITNNLMEFNTFILLISFQLKNFNDILKLILINGVKNKIILMEFHYYNVFMKFNNLLYL